MRLQLLAANAACLILFVAASASSAAEQRPNIVLIVVDDLGWKDLGCQGSTFYETRHIDALATQGLRFTQAYAACAVCSPTRAAVLTGKYPARLGVTDWIRPRNNRDPREFELAKSGGLIENGTRPLLTPANRFELALDEVTLAERLKDVGYATCHVGKWHLGDPGHLPTDQGFDRNAGGYDYGQPPSYFDPYVSKRLPQGIPTLPPRRTGEYLADREADEAVRFIRENREGPFFLSYWPYEVHTPLQAKPGLIEYYKKKAGGAEAEGEQRNATYAGMVHGLDDAVGRITAALQELQLTGSTLIVFTSDNGGLLGPTNNAPLRSGKGYPYEGGLRVPLIVSWPDVVPQGVKLDTPVCSIDLAPTLCEVAGVPMPEEERDGLSLWSHIVSSGRETIDREALVWHFPHYRQQDVEPYSVLRSGTWKLIKRYEGPSFELFDLAADPYETRDLSATRPDLVERLDRDLSSRLTAQNARLPQPRSPE